MSESPLTADLLRRIVRYDPLSGQFWWCARPVRRGLEKVDRAWNTRLAGKLVGQRIDRRGYLRIGIWYKNYAAHRLAWLYVHGEWPAGALDHVNRDRADNRIANLRLATQSQNNGNARLSSRNTSGFRGVTRDRHRKGWWRAQLFTQGRCASLGSFPTREQASEAYRKAASEYFGPFLAP